MSTTETPIVSHGRGGAGNINPDPTKYVDGEITRQGVVGSHNDGAFSTGRGGAANIVDADMGNAAKRADKEVIPEAAVRPSTENKDYHVGRGGAGNTHIASKTGDAPMSFADKLKYKLFGRFKK